MTHARESHWLARQTVLAVFALGLTLRAAIGSLVYTIVYNEQGASLSWAVFQPTLISERWVYLDELHTITIAVAAVLVAIQWPGFVGGGVVVTTYLGAQIAVIFGGLLGYPANI